MHKVKEPMNMTGFHDTDYGTRTNQSHYQPVSQADHAGLTAKVPQSSFSQRVTANLKMGYLYGNVDLVTGQELYMNYDKSSSEEDPVMLAEGIDIHGNAFRRSIHLNDIDVRNASIVEMTALNVHLNKQGDEVIKSHYSFPLETLSGQYDLNSKINFEQYFQKTAETLQTAGYRQQVELYKSELERYLFFQTTGRLRKKSEKEHVLFEKEENKTGVFSNKTLAEVAGVNLSSEIDWESVGTGKLTEDQVQYLKEKYNVEDMTEEDYYHLMGELSGMNVISGKEAEKQLLRQAPPCTYMITPAYEGAFGGRHFPGNYLRKLGEETDYTEFVLSMLQQGKCSIGPESALGAVRDFYKKQLEYNRKIEGIFQQLQRDTTKTNVTYGNEKA